MPEALVRCATIAVTATGPPLSATVARTTRGGRSCSGSVAPQNGSSNVSAAPSCVTCPTVTRAVRTSTPTSSPL